MSNQNMNESIVVTPPDAAIQSVESRLRGEALDGAEQKAAVDHVEYEKSRNLDAELHLDGEDDSLYSDGLNVGDGTLPLAGSGDSNPKGIKG
jgi:hypothetical protein